MKDIQYPIIGTVHFCKRKGIKRISMKVNTDGEIYVTMPYISSIRMAESFVLSHKEWIQKQQSKWENNKQKFTESRKRFTHFHDLIITKGIDNSLRITANESIIKVVTPQDIPIEKEHIQDEITKAIEYILKKEAQQYLPQRIKELATLHNFTYKNISISNAHTRWGCCSSIKNIRFSQYIMTLPYHLIDYVILHELCHTIHMNHSDDFYKLLDKVCGGMNKQYRIEIKQCRMNVFPKFTEENENELNAYN